MRKKNIYIIIFLFITFIFFNNTSLFTSFNASKPLLLAHRGLAQTFDMAGITNDTDTSKRIFPPEHQYLENTRASMEAAFNLGADIVELDIQMTRDNKFAVFHDHTLAYRTNGTGAVKEHTMSELAALDIGYGYSADGGKTFPFRGKGAGLMPELDEVFKAFPQKNFLIHIKSNDTAEGELLAGVLKSQPLERLNGLRFYGGDRPMKALKEKMPEARVMSKETLVNALLEYIACGWTGYVPKSCRGAWLHIPLKYAPLLWGWPYKFLSRMKSVDTQVVLVAGDGKFSEGFDSVEDLKKVPENFPGYIWTNRIDKVAPQIKR